MTIREATISDVGAMLAIYAPYVEQTAVTFEYDMIWMEKMIGEHNENDVKQ